MKVNMLEQRIKEIHSEEPYQYKQDKRSYTKVDITTNCYGGNERKVKIFPTDMWLEIKDKGYYMA